MLTDSQKKFIYQNYLKIPLKDIIEFLGVNASTVNRFIGLHTVAEMLDNFEELKKEGFEPIKVSKFEKLQIEKTKRKKEIVIIQSKLNNEKGNDISEK